MGKLENDELGLTSKIVALIKRGSPRSTAAAAAGIRLATFNDWLYKGSQGQQPYKRFAKAIDTAEAEVEALLASAFFMGAKDDWRAAEAYLKARFPERWAKQDPEAVKDLRRLVGIMRAELPIEDFLRILDIWDFRSTIED